jgi:hypothetical protein
LIPRGRLRRGGGGCLGIDRDEGGEE